MSNRNKFFIAMKIALLGDVMLGRLVNHQLKRVRPEYPWGDTLPILQQADLCICNLECALSDIGNPWSTPPKMFHFRTDQKNIASLKAAHIGMASLANNHVLDYEDEALMRMLQVLDSHHIQHAGAGKDWTQASQPAISIIQGQKIGMLAFTDNEPSWEASADKAGVFYVPIDLNAERARTLLQLTQKMKQKVDFLILSAHWGPNWGYDPPKEHRSFAKALIDSGADLIFGHSGHVFRGIEIYNGCPIIYCAGDFIDDYAVDEIEKNDESFIFLIDLKPANSLLYLYPTVIRDFQARLASQSEQKAILFKMQDLCKKLGTSLINKQSYGLIEL